MKKFFALIFAALLSAPFFSLEVPKLTGPVVDLAGLLEQDKFSELEDYLLSVDASYSAQIAALIIPSLQGDSLEEYSIRVAREWALGNERDSKGVLLLVAFKEKKIRIETGYGAEGSLTDAKCGLIIRNVMAPKFKDGDYAQGILDGVKAIAGVVTDGEAGESVNIEGDDNVDFVSAIAVTIFFLLYFFMFTGSMATKFRVFRWLPWAPLFIRKANGPRTGAQKFYDEYYGSDLFSTGSGGGSSGFGGGGFSGHGGGFGGGGASGGW